MAVSELAIAEKSIGLLEKGAAIIPKVFRSLDDKIKYQLRAAHIEYCCNVIKKYCRARTFFIRNEPQFLEDFYVPASIIKHAGRRSIEGRRIERAGLELLAKIARCCIVTGNGGSGKTIFMRHLLLDAIEQGVGYPVFIELRNFNETDGVNLEKMIFASMHDHGFSLGEEYIKKSLEEGLLVVLLDGFDEVILSKRKKLEKEIRKLGSTSKSQIVISSRPDMILDGWDGFSTVDIAPLELEEACELIDKIRFDEDDEIKVRFIEKLRGGLFKSHQYFLSNPLLLSIMLLTYGDSADIPKKFASFYEQAYTALFQKHDALKSGFRRERQTDLDIYEFSRLFSAFSAITYNKRMFRFSILEAVAGVNQAKSISRVRDVSSEGFLDDAKQAVCLLVDDGLDLAYVHRSFQEYFVAKFISESDDAIQRDYIRSISIERAKFQFNQDNVLQILYEMNPAVVEDNYLVPSLKVLFGKSSGRKISLASWRLIFSKTIDELHRLDRGSDDYGFSVKNWSFFSVLSFVRVNCTRGAFERGADVLEDTNEIFGGDMEVVVKSIPVRSKLWLPISRSAGFLSLSAIEAVRNEYLSMVKRSEERAKAVVDIFDFSKGGQ